MWPALRRYPAHPSVLDPHLLLQKGDLMPQAVVVDLKPSARVEKVFTPAQRQTSFIEDGSDLDDGFIHNPPHPNEYCPCKPQLCDFKTLDAYYVTARYTGGSGSGESPRSNVLLVQWNTQYARLHDNEPASFDAVADNREPSEDLACWNTKPEPDALLALLDRAAELSTAGIPHTTEAEAIPLQTAAMRTLGVTNPPWVLFDLHTDHLGTVRVITNNAGAIVSTHDYYPFGEPMKSLSSFNTHQFTGHERDAESGMDYMLARYYGGSIGRFLSVDPIMNPTRSIRRPARWNRYTYVLDNPLRFVDPNGEETEVAIGRATNRNGYGHIAIIQDGLVYSQGTHYSGKKDWGVPRDAYFNQKGEGGLSQNDQRETRVVKLKTTPEQESRLKGILAQGPGDYNNLTNTCAQATERPLESAGVLKTTEGPVRTDSAGNLLQAGDTDSNTPEGVEEKIEEQGVIDGETLEGTPATNPKSKPATLVNGLSGGKSS
jgi:RHS repeat-associated protein